MDRIPVDQFLDIVNYFPLPSLISALGVCRSWQLLVPCAPILSTRRDLLKLYLNIVRSPSFRYTRPWILANLRLFNRQNFIDAILAQHPYVPEAFRIWILKWPARAVIWRAWPGLPRFDGRSKKANPVQRIEGVNWMAYEDAYPEVSAFAFNVETPKPEYIPVLCVWQSFSGPCSWLVLDKRSSIRDKVYQLHYNSFEEDDVEDHYDSYSIFQDWTAYMEFTWKWIEINANQTLSKGPILPSLESPEVAPLSDNEQDLVRPRKIPAPSWHLRNEPEVLAELF